MKFITPILLISKQVETDDIGDQSVVEKERKVLANKLSIGTKEFYEAHTAGMKPEIKLEVRSLEYKNEQSIKMDGIAYEIIRTYDNQEGIIELTCSRGVHSAST